MKPAAGIEAELGQIFLPILDEPSARRLEPAIRSGRLAGGLLRRDCLPAARLRVFLRTIKSWSLSCAPQRPFLVAVDHEGGPLFTSRAYGTSFPGNMALGAARDKSLTERAARAAALELRSLGIAMDFAPVLDVNRDPDNPIIGLRSFGDSAAAVARHGLAALRGYLSGGIIPVVKHFPGHGDTDVDSHIGLPTIRKSPAELARREWIPFRAAIKAGAPAVMTAHALFPALDPKDPATLSKKIIAGLLRREMGFKGVIVSDSLDMGAISKKLGPGAACVQALEAGCDLLILGASGFESAYDAVLSAVRLGKLPRDRIHEAFLRVKKLKDKFLARRAEPLNRNQMNSHAEISRLIAERSTTLVKDEPGLLPLGLSSREELLLVLFNTERFRPEADFLLREIRRRHEKSLAVRAPASGRSAVLEAARKADQLLIGTFAWSDSPRPSHVHLTRALLSLKKPTILLSLMNPYDLRHYPEARTAMCCYGMTRPALEAAVRAIFGEFRPRGRLPVKISQTRRRDE